MGGPDRDPAGAPHRLEGPALDARLRRARPRTPTPASPPRPASARPSRPSGRTRRASRSRRSCSAAAAPAPCRWSPSPSTGSTAPSSVPRSRPRRPPRPPARSASCAATRSPCCRSAATTWATTWPTGSRSASRPPRRRQAAADLLRQLVPQGRRRQVAVAGLRREQPGAQVDRRPARGHASTGVRTPIGVLPAVDELDLDGLDVPAARPRAAAVGRRRGLEAGGGAHARVLRAVRRPPAAGHRRRAGRPRGAARRRARRPRVRRTHLPSAPRGVVSPPTGQDDRRHESRCGASTGPPCRSCPSRGATAAASPTR